MADPDKLVGQIALVTGAGQGIGREIGTVLAEHEAAAAAPESWSRA